MSDYERAALIAVLDPADSSRHSGHLWAGRSLHAAQAQEIANAIIEAGFTRRPVPSRDEVLATVREFICDEWVLGQVSPADEECADAVLALFEGAEG